MVASSLIAPANRSVGEPPIEFPAVTVQFPSESGCLVKGWHRVVPDASATVILLHPVRGDRRDMLGRAKLLRNRGYSTLLIDLQAHGESTGENITVGFLEKFDVLAAVDFVRDANPNHKIGIIGRSLGGASTLFANPDVDLIVLESVYPSIEQAVHNRVAMRIGSLHSVVAPLLLLQLKPRLGISVDQLRPIDQLPKINCPVLFASGDSDTHTTIEETRRMYEAVKAVKKLVVFEGAKHEDLLPYDKEKYQREVLDFVDQILGG
jgi:fermentation-respiration switch protein FrsA (DUF1100 family)